MDLQLWGFLLNFDWLVSQLSVLTFQPLIIIYRRGNFMFYLWGCISFYRSLSYPFRSLISIPKQTPSPASLSSQFKTPKLRMDIEYTMDIMTEEKFTQFRLLTSTSIIGQFIHPVGLSRLMEGIVILASYKFYFIRVHDNLV